MKITKNELKEMINESVERQLRKTIHQRNNHKRKVNEQFNTKYEYFPKNNDELEQIIHQQIKKYGANCNLNMIDTSRIKDMSYLFFDLKFNGDISEWDVSNVTNMSMMFYQSNFNGDISKWNVGNVKNMHGMFHNSKFNKNISKWNVSNVITMRALFNSSKFNQNISNWNVSKVADMHAMFAFSYFNQDISKWNISKVTDMSFMFKDSDFNQNISKWFNKLKSKINLENFGIFNKIKIDSYDDFENYYRTVNKF